jgi:hypothetical protein
MVVHRTHLLIVFSLGVIGAFALFVVSKNQNLKPEQIKTTLKDQVKPETWALPDPTPNDTHDYKQLIAKLEAERSALAFRYHQASSTAQQAEIIAQARTVVTRSIYAEIFPAWYGTVWDFNGTTEVPQEGKIACGYFVSTVLRDAGWKVQRAQLAQQASENIILSLTTNDYVQRFRKVSITEFVKAVKKWGTGIYVVGLDIHTGFIVNTGAEVYFIHSSYVEPYMVVREKANESKILAASNYRVLGKLTADDLLIEKWLLSKEIVTRTA